VEFVEHPHGRDAGRIVGGQERVELLHGAQDGFVEKLRAADVAGADGLEPDGGESAESAECFFREPDRRAVIGEEGGAFPDRLVSKPELERRLRAANAFDAPLGENALGRHFKQAELE